MYENLQEALTHKRFVPSSRPFPSPRLQDQYAVEPWDKTTIQIQIRDEPIRQVKTFYNAPRINRHHRHYTTQRGFNYQQLDQSRQLHKPKSLAEVTRKSAVSAYNISGNILGETFSSQKYMPFQLPCKKTKSFRSKDKSTYKKQDQIEPIPARETVNAMKRRINLRTQQQVKDYVCLNVDNVEETPQHSYFGRKKSKVINLGFQKIAQMKQFPRQKSMQLVVKNSMQ